ncbi:hypothetical protein LJR289_003020 [Pseudoduganella sp. LjRoot289]|uniref:hypothetical protein n=1 Tax=Pseudoduganella sp. LjRoot289 TaxID=3342314 RepID=UPI003ECC2605
MTILTEGTPGNAKRSAPIFSGADGLLALPDHEGHALAVERPSAQLSQAVLAALRASSPALECDADNLLCLRDGQATHVVCPSRQATRPDSMADLLKQPTVLGAVVTRSMGEDGCHVDHVVLAEPVPGLACSVHVIVQHRSGQLAMAGWGELAHGQLLFHLQAVDRPGAVPVAVAGCLGEGRLDITHAAAARAAPH